MVNLKLLPDSVLLETEQRMANKSEPYYMIDISGERHFGYMYYPKYKSNIYCTFVSTKKVRSAGCSLWAFQHNSIWLYAWNISKALMKVYEDRIEYSGGVFYKTNFSNLKKLW